MSGVIALVVTLVAYAYNWNQTSDDIYKFVEKLPKDPARLTLAFMMLGFVLLGPIALARVIIELGTKRK